jgi:competence protein ComEA
LINPHFQSNIFSATRQAVMQHRLYRKIPCAWFEPKQDYTGYLLLQNHHHAFPLTRNHFGITSWMLKSISGGIRMKRVGLHLFLVALVSLCMGTISFAAGETKPAATGVAKPTPTVKPVAPGVAKPTLTVVPAKGAKKSAAVAKKVALIDINSASAKQLKALPGLTDHDVKKIIAGRPYTRKDELKWKQIITEPAYNVIEANIIAKQTAKPAKSTKAAKPAKAVEPAKTAKPAEPAKTAKPSK